MLDFWIGCMTLLVAAAAASGTLRATVLLSDFMDYAYRRGRAQIAMLVPIRTRH